MSPSSLQASATVRHAAISQASSFPSPFASSVLTVPSPINDARISWIAFVQPPFGKDDVQGRVFGHGAWRRRSVALYTDPIDGLFVQWRRIPLHVQGRWTWGNARSTFPPSRAPRPLRASCQNRYWKGYVKGEASPREPDAPRKIPEACRRFERSKPIRFHRHTRLRPSNRTRRVERGQPSFRPVEADWSVASDVAHRGSYGHALVRRSLSPPHLPIAGRISRRKKSRRSPVQPPGLAGDLLVSSRTFVGVWTKTIQWAWSGGNMDKKERGTRDESRRWMNEDRS